MADNNQKLDLPRNVSIVIIKQHNIKNCYSAIKKKSEDEKAT